MKTYEKRVLRDLLEKASETFSNHGCNDYSFKFLSDEDARTFSQEVNNVMKMDFDASDKVHLDWILMDYFAELLHRSIECDKVDVTEKIKKFLSEEFVKEPSLHYYVHTDKNTPYYCVFTIYGKEVSIEEKNQFKAKLLQLFLPYARWSTPEEVFLVDENGSLFILEDQGFDFEITRV